MKLPDASNGESGFESEANHHAESFLRSIHGLPVLPFQLRQAGYAGHVGQDRISIDRL
ncbi:MAG: hypothetical protein O7C75_05450 [Verrucomicrobia bacterium]|nr:hypothetical protein [Verrucomicrobiota bacterium]